MLKIKKTAEGLEVDFGFVVIDNDNGENQYFYNIPHTITTIGSPYDEKNKAINIEAVRVLKEKINQTLLNLEYAVKNQHNENYLLEIGEPVKGFTAVNTNKW